MTTTEAPRRRRVSKYGPPPTDAELRAAGRSLSSGRTDAQRLADLRWWDRQIELATALAARRKAKALKASPRPAVA